MSHQPFNSWLKPGEWDLIQTLTDATSLQIDMTQREFLTTATPLNSPKTNGPVIDCQILKELALNQLQQSTTGTPQTVGGGGLQATASGGMHIQLLT